MNEPDDLRDRLARLDPAEDLPVRSATGPEGRALLEEIMSTPVNTDTRGLDGPPAVPPERDAPRNSRRWWLGGAAAAAVAAIAVAGVLVIGGGDGASDEPEVAGGAKPGLELSLGEGQDMMASCMQMSPELLAPVQLAFAGTAREVDGERVVLDVTRWYTGGDAEAVELTAPGGLVALTGGIDFEVGGEYLIAAENGTVDYCGMSGPATPELQSFYDAAFPG